METTTELSAMLEAPTWDAKAVQQARRAAFESSKHIDQFRSWVSRMAQQDDRQSNLKAGVGLFLLGQYEAAADQLRQASEGDLKRYYMGLAYREMGLYEQSLEELARAEDRGWDKFDVAMQRVETLRRAGRLDEARKLLARHEAAGAGSAEYHFQRGCLLKAEGQYQPAMEALAQALEIDPGHRGACFQQAYLNDLVGDESQAIRLYRRCVESPPAAVNALINLAVLYEDQGKCNLAIRCLQEALRVDPNHPRARLYLKDALAGLTQFYDEVQERARDRRSAILDIPITDFELSVRSRNCLKKMNIHTLGDLLRVTEEELLNFKNFGETSLNEIRAVLAQKGLRLGQALDESRAEEQRRGVALPRPTAAEDILGKNVDELELSVRARRCLERLGLRTLGDVASRTEAELLASKNFGITSLAEVKKQLAIYGLSLRRLEE